MSSFNSHVIKYSVLLDFDAAQQQAGSFFSNIAGKSSQATTGGVNAAKSILSGVGNPTLEMLTNSVQLLTSSISKMFSSDGSGALTTASKAVSSVGTMTINAAVVNLNSSGSTLSKLSNISPMEAAAKGQSSGGGAAVAGGAASEASIIGPIGIAVAAIGALSTAAIGAAEALAPFNSDLFAAVTGFEFAMTGLKMKLAEDIGPALANTLSKIEQVLIHAEPTLAHIANAALKILDVCLPLVDGLTYLLEAFTNGALIMADMVAFLTATLFSSNAGIKDAYKKLMDDVNALMESGVKNKAKAEDFEKLGNQLFMGLFNSLDKFAHANPKAFGMQHGADQSVPGYASGLQGFAGVGNGVNGASLTPAQQISAAKAGFQAVKEFGKMQHEAAEDLADLSEFADDVSSALKDSKKKSADAWVDSTNGSPSSKTTTGFFGLSVSSVVGGAIQSLVGGVGTLGNVLTNASKLTAQEHRADTHGIKADAVPRATAASVTLKVTDKIEFLMQESLHEQTALDFAKTVMEHGRNLFDDRCHKIWTTQMAVNTQLTRGIQ